MLEDGFGRRFHYLRLSITEICNFRCNYCLPDGTQCAPDADYLCVSEIRTLVSAFARLGTSKIRLTGGEPTLRRDLAKIIEVCSHTPGIERVALTSNAYNLTRHIDSYAKAGLNAINISADSLDPAMFAAITGRNLLDKVLAGVDAALASGITTVKLNTVLLKQFNGNEMGRILDYLRDKALTWRFIELMQTGDNAAFFKDNHISGEVIRQQLLADGWQRIVRERQAGPALEYQHPDYIGRIGLIMPYSKDFCASCNRLRVSSSGKLHLCLFADTGFDIRSHLRSGDIDATCEAIMALMPDKKASHFLTEGFTGATRQLAMLGG
ncbi:MAG: GTP 3',8-cyclase MoaA [Parahaliea sp.]